MFRESSLKLLSTCLCLIPASVQSSNTVLMNCLYISFTNAQCLRHTPHEMMFHSVAALLMILYQSWAFLLQPGGFWSLLVFSSFIVHSSFSFSYSKVFYVFCNKICLQFIQLAKFSSSSIQTRCNVLLFQRLFFLDKEASVINLLRI